MKAIGFHHDDDDGEIPKVGAFSATFLELSHECREWYIRTKGVTVQLIDSHMQLGGPRVTNEWIIDALRACDARGVAARDGLFSTPAHFAMMKRGIWDPNEVIKLHLYAKAGFNSLIMQYYPLVVCAATTNGRHPVEMGLDEADGKWVKHSNVEVSAPGRTLLEMNVPPHRTRRLGTDIWECWLFE